MIVLYILLALSLVAVVVTLLMGGRAMVSNKEADRSNSNKWMWRRVWAQASAIILLLIIVWVRSRSG